MERSAAFRARVLSSLVAVLSGLASGLGFFMRDIYRDNRWTATQLLGNDAVTLFVATPALLLGLVLWALGSRRGAILNLAMLHYMLYNFAFYLFGTAFNFLFLAYAAIFALSILALVFGLSSRELPAIASAFSGTAPARAAGAWLIFVALVVGGLWTALSIVFIASGRLPQVLVDSGHPTSVVFAVDLGLLVPFLILGGVWLYARKPWGYVLGTALLISSATYTLALAAMGVSADKTVVLGAAFLVPLWMALSLASLGLAVSMLARFAPRPKA